MNLRHLPCLSSALALLILLPGAAQAEDYRLPPTTGAQEGVELTEFLRVKPYARFFTYYTTNLFQEPNRRKEEDVGFELTGGTDVLIGDPNGNNIELGYSATQLLFVKNPKQNTVEHSTRFNLLFEPSKLVKFTASGSGNWSANNTDPQFRGRVRNFGGFGTAAIEVRPIETVGFLVDGDVTYSQNFPRAFEPFNNLVSRAGTFLVLNPNLPGKLEFLAGGNWRQIHYVDHKATNPDFEGVSFQGGARASNDLIQMEFRAGYEFIYVKKRRSFSRRFSTDDGFFANASITITPNETTTLTVFGLHQLTFSAVSSSQRNSHVGASIDQQIPFFKDLRVFAAADWDLQNARRAAKTRTQSYRGGAGWSPTDWLEVGTQAAYLRTSTKTGGFETFEYGITLTFQL